MKPNLILGDCIEVLKTFDDNSIDSVVCDPPYELGFMGKSWDATGIANRVDMWAEVFRVLKPGGHLVAFSGTRTYHRMACAIEDAGFEIRDQLGWMYGSGFPKSHDVSKAIDKAAAAVREVVGERKKLQSYGKGEVYGGGPDKGGIQQITAPATDAAKQWQGWGTALKPAWEPICLARKPLIGTVAENVLEHGTGAINIDGCRVETTENLNGGGYSGDKRHDGTENWRMRNGGAGEFVQPVGRWPANIIHDGSDEVLAMFPETKGWSGQNRKNFNPYGGNSLNSSATERGGYFSGFNDNGSAARFFYCSKVSKKERGEGNNHPTVKPIALMSYLCRLVTPPNGTVLDPFMGSGSTGIAAMNEGFNFIGIEKEQEYLDIATHRITSNVSITDFI